MRSYKFKINGNEYNVDINSVEGNIANVTVNGATYEVEMDTPVSAPVAAAAVKDSSASLRMTAMRCMASQAKAKILSLVKLHCPGGR